ncbi:hypothetical protein R8Z50_25360 [Longispora sp. K20-0274]|uniref:hypothetical protein n=1 Tax=Longispora sp. K20-0274 TaxID=3088255 RepID=UPI00399AE0A6
MRMMTTPKPGDLLVLDRDASPQFAGRSLTVRVIRMTDRRSSVGGWGWAEVYVLDPRGDATGRREVFVHLAGLRPRES